MKKILSIFILLSLLLCLTACRAPEPLPMTTEGENRVDGKVSYTLCDLYRADSLSPAIPLGEYQVYEAPEDTHLWVMVMDVENLTGFGAAPNDLLPLHLTLEETRYTPAAYVLAEGGTALVKDATIASGSQARVLYVFSMPAETSSALITATIAGQPYTTTVTPNDGPRVQRTSLGSSLNGGTLILKTESFFATQKLKPTQPATMHTFFDAGEGNTYLVLKTTVLNRGSEPVPCTQLAGVTVGTTACVPILEAADGSDLTTDGTIAPGDSRTVYYAAAFPADQHNKKATVTISLYTDIHRLTATPADDVR